MHNCGRTESRVILGGPESFVKVTSDLYLEVTDSSLQVLLGQRQGWGLRVKGPEGNLKPPGKAWGLGDLEPTEGLGLRGWDGGYPTPP